MVTWCWNPASACVASQISRSSIFPVTQKLPFGGDMDFYWSPDDTHWLPRGAELAADMIVAESRGEASMDLLNSRRDVIAKLMQRETSKQTP
jgi:hypothetical protein